MTVVARRILSIEKDEWSEAFQTALVVLLEDRVRVIAGASSAQQQEVLDQVKSFLTAKSERGLRPQDAELAVAAATALESGGNLELAAEAYSDFAKLVAESKDEKVSGMAEMLEGAVRRLGLPGKAIKLEGARMDGSAFDWAAYRGKVVLVYFWASDSALCRAELPGVKLNYQLYHDRGLEVLGISADRDRQALAEFLQQEEIPWVTLHEKDPEAMHPAVTYYGVTDSPTALLVDKEGKVASVRARGGELDMLLEKSLGPPYVPRGELSYVDLSSKANLKLNADFDSLERNNNLANLPRGEQTFGGVRFKVGESVIHLGQRQRPDFPVKIEGIPVNRTLARLYVFQGAQWGSAADGTQIGEYRVHYEDGTEHSIPIVIGQDVRDWWNTDGSKAVTRGKVVWVGENEASQADAQSLRLYMTVWNNPQRDRKVNHIDFVESPSGNAGPFCVAITAEAAGSSEAEQ
jgi:peroxiredoxin